MRNPEWLVRLRKREGLTRERFLASAVRFSLMKGVRIRAGVMAVVEMRIEATLK